MKHRKNLVQANDHGTIFRVISNNYLHRKSELSCLQFDSERDSHLKRCVELLNETGIVRVGVTTDNPPVNHKVFDHLAANVDESAPRVT